jgi:hypothetical protein
VTTTNALHYAFKTSQNDETRRFLLLQIAAFIPLFRQAMASRGKMQDQPIDQLATVETAQAPELGEIFATVSKDRLLAARQTLTYLEKNNNDPRGLIDAARLLVFLKGTDSHDYKFSSAVMEDCYAASPAWRNRYLAASLFQLRGSGGADNKLVGRTRAALKG